MNLEVEMIRQYVIDESLCRGRGFSRRDEDKWRRYYLATLLRWEYEVTLFKIGEIFGLNHATIIHSLKTWEDIKHYPEVQQATKQVRELFPFFTKAKEMKITSNEVKSLLILENYASRENNHAVC